MRKMFKGLFHIKSTKPYNPKFKIKLNWLILKENLTLINIKFVSAKLDYCKVIAILNKCTFCAYLIMMIHDIVVFDIETVVTWLRQ